MMNIDSRPLLAITMGDPAGIGPETIAGALEPSDRLFLLPAGGHRPRRDPASSRNLTRHRSPSSPDRIGGTGRAGTDTIPCLTVCDDDVLDLPPGAFDARGGEAAYRALIAAADLAIAGRIDGLTTAPLHKEALHLAGHRYPGHTELLAELCQVDDFAMMLYLAGGEKIVSPGGLAIVHVTLHMALRDVFANLTTDAVLVKERLVDDVMTRLTGSRPRIGVCALNPHAGEAGLFGDEESRIIAPAVERGRAAGLDVRGPLPADTLIARARAGEFDAVVAMYHDQGHIAIKLLEMHRAVNVTLGLPIVRTSVAHGTAFDLAWQGNAETSGMIEALRVASRLATRRNASK